jgi:hydroxypyruvate reductase
LRPADFPTGGGPATACVLIAAGKAAPLMAASAMAHLSLPIRQALVISATAASVPGTDVIVGGHPAPTAASERAGRRALALAGSLSGTEALLVLLSGGASALMAVPADGVTLDDKREATVRLLRGGADIYALNTVRKHLSAIKGGWLAATARGRCTALAVSDVVGDDASVIASGPTVPDRSRFEHALDVLRRFGGEDGYPRAVVTRLRRGERGEIEETPKPGDRRLAGAATRIIGSRLNAMDGAVREAAERGYHVVRLDHPVIGEARQAAVSEVREIFRRADRVARPACFVASGETTVRVTGRGKGGRNQEFVLAASGLFAEAGTPSAVVSVGTDGVDGPTDAAGAYADSSTAARAAAAGLSAEGFLADNDAYAFFAALGDLVHTGLTGTNVGDLQIVLLA